MTIRFRVPLRHPFHAEWEPTPARLADGRCAVLTGTFSELVEAARAGATADCALLVLHYPDRPFLTRTQRDTLWDTFGVPAFMLLLDPHGRIAAWECEAQDGLHVGAAWTGQSLWSWRLLAGGWAVEKRTCECGRPGERLCQIPRRPPAREDRPAAVLQEA
jgi:hypothetical protein